MARAALTKQMDPFQVYLHYLCQFLFQSDIETGAVSAPKSLKECGTFQYKKTPQIPARLHLAYSSHPSLSKEVVGNVWSIQPKLKCSLCHLSDMA